MARARTDPLGRTFDEFQAVLYWKQDEFRNVRTFKQADAEQFLIRHNHRCVIVPRGSCTCLKLRAFTCLPSSHCSTDIIVFRKMDIIVLFEKQSALLASATGQSHILTNTGSKPRTNQMKVLLVFIQCNGVQIKL